MTKEFIEVIHNLESGEIIERPFTKDEIQAALIERAAMENIIKENERKAIQKAALLTKLGISEDEAKLLLS